MLKEATIPHCHSDVSRMGIRYEPHTLTASLSMMYARGCIICLCVIHASGLLWLSAYRFKRQREPLSLWSVPHSTPLCTKIKLRTRHTPPLKTGCSLLEVLESFSLPFFFTNKPYYKRNMANRVRYLNKYTSYISFVESLHFYRSFPRRVSCTLA